MAMQAGGGTQKGGINVTPMIDVLLVLLIIFMVIVPLSPVGFETRVPREPEENAAPSSEARQLVVTVHPDGSADFNRERVEAGQVAGRFREVFRSRGNRVVFVRVENEMAFEPVAQVIDAARGAELTQIALLRMGEETQ